MVGHAGGEAADQTAVAGIAVLVVPLYFLGFVVLLGPHFLHHKPHFILDSLHQLSPPVLYPSTVLSL